MKTILYIFLLIAEFLVGFSLLTLATSVTGWIYFAIITAVWAVLMVSLLIKLKKIPPANDKRKIKISIALVMLLPTIAGVAGLGWFIWSMSSAGLI